MDGRGGRDRGEARRLGLEHRAPFGRVEFDEEHAPGCRDAITLVDAAAADRGTRFDRKRCAGRAGDAGTDIRPYGRVHASVLRPLAMAALTRAGAVPPI